MSNILDFNTALPLDQLEAASRGRTSVDAEDIKSRIHAEARSFVEWLFSGRAFCSSHEARIGDVYGTPGASLSIRLTGPDAGLWKDHATGEGGDLISLYMANMGYGDRRNFQLALKEIASEFLGDPVQVERQAWQQTATQRIAEKKQKLGTKPRSDLIELGAPVATYRYYDTRGNVVASVVRYEPDGTRENKTFRPYCFRTEGGAKKWTMGAPDLRPLYRLPDIVLASSVVLTEGEGKADALAQLGICATTAMQGSKAPIEKTDWSPLYGKTVIVWPDNDDPGRDYGRRVSEHLARLGCSVRVVQIPDGKRPKWDAADCIAEGGDPASLIASAVSITAEGASGDVFKLYTLEELDNLPAPVWLVDGVMVENGLCLFWAGSDNFKTFVAIDIAMCIATGTAWHGRETIGGPVVYVAAEDLSGVKLRMDGWARTKGKDLPAPDIRLLNDSFTMASPDADKLIRSIELLPQTPRLIVIDTLARSFGAGNEDKTSDMNAFVDGCDKIRRATGATIMVVHHTGRNAEQERGNVALRGACDVIFTVQRVGKSGRIKLINTPPKGKQKNAEPFSDIHLRMQKIHFQQHDTEKSTLIVMADEAGPEESDAGQDIEDDEDEDAAPRLGRIERSILDALEKAARGGRDSLGFTSLLAQIGGDKGNFARALRKLVEKGHVSQDGNYYARST